MSETDAYPSPQETTTTASFICAHSVPSAVLSPKCVLPHQILTATLRRRYSNPYFTDEEIEDQRAEATELGSGRSVL